MANQHDLLLSGAQIKVFGIGGGGTNAINTMIRSNIEGVEFIAANTDMQSLKFSLATKKIQIGRELTKGLGAGADPDIGRDAALEDRHEIHEALAGADMVFITAGMGGGTGTGGASVVAQIAKDIGALTVGVVTKPFFFEGNRRKKHALIGIERIREYVDTLIVIPNQQLINIATPDLSMIDAFKLADTVLVNAVKGISDIINVPGTVNVDFADVKTIMSSTGRALMGIGSARGEKRAAEAATKAISSPLLEDVDIEGATGILINITAGENISLFEVNEACSIIQEAAHEDANIIFGAVIDENLSDEIRVTVIATGFPAEQKPEKTTNVMRRFAAETLSNSFNTNNDRKTQIEKPVRKEEPTTVSSHTSPEKLQTNISQSPNKKDYPLSNPIPKNILDLNDESEDLAFLTLQHAEAQSTNFTLNELAPKESQSNFKQPTQKQDDAFKLDYSKFENFESPSSQSNHLDHLYIDDHKTFSRHIDKKIDEALNLADQISEESDDKLEIPTFLRNKSTELSAN